MSVKPEDLKKLKEPFPVKWRVQKVNQNAALCVAYIDARDVQNRLDDVCGMENWQSTTKVEKGNLYTELEINVNDSWLKKTDVGKPSEFESEKGEVSDSLKRAAVQWGVGRFLYDMEITKLPVHQHKTKDGKIKYIPTKLDKKTILWNGADLTAYLNERIGLMSDSKGEYSRVVRALIPLISNEKLATNIYKMAKGLRQDKDFLEALEERVKELRNG